MRGISSVQGDVACAIAFLPSPHLDDAVLAHQRRELAPPCCQLHHRRGDVTTLCATGRLVRAAARVRWDRAVRRRSARLCVWLCARGCCCCAMLCCGSPTVDVCMCSCRPSFVRSPPPLLVAAVPVFRPFVRSSCRRCALSCAGSLRGRSRRVLDSRPLVPNKEERAQNSAR